LTGRDRPTTRDARPLLGRGLVASVSLIAATAVGCSETAPADLDAPGDRVATTALEGTSGGPRIAAQAAFDVRFYDLTVRVEPADSTIMGRMDATVTALEVLDEVVLHLDSRLTVTTAGPVAEGEFRPTDFRHEDGLLSVPIGREMAPGEDVEVRIDYGGRPLVSEAVTSWADGFYWRETATGEPWIGVVSVLQGGDLWWPAVDHPADEPDSMAIRVRVADPVLVAANGTLRRVESHGDGTSTHHWFVSTPINNYAVSINIGPYEVLETTYESVSGEEFPFQFWVLPESLDDGRRLFEQMPRDMAFFEELLGPYPFRGDKYALVHTPYIAMEHQSAIAYGSDFRNNDFGFDFYHFHELAHEWWANKLTARDWRDWWLHEGFATYMEALYAEQLGGPEAYHEYVSAWRPRIANASPVVPGPDATTHDAYTGDIYRKGAAVLHTLRYLIGRDALVEVFRRMHDRPADPGGEACGCRSIDTGELVDTIREVAGTDVTRILAVYLRESALPELEVSPSAAGLELRWSTEGNEPFDLPVEVRVDGYVQRIPMTGGVGTLEVPEGAAVEIDPEAWILMSSGG